MSSKRNGFTLVEILVVLGIIAVLLAILLPVLARARDAPLRAACASNLRQIHMAMHMYCQDNDDTYPHAVYYVPNGNHDPVSTYWPDLILPYMKMPLTCPSRVVAEPFATLRPSLQIGYAPNAGLFDLNFVKDASGETMGITLVGRTTAAVGGNQDQLEISEARVGIITLLTRDTSRMSISFVSLGNQETIKSEPPGGDRHAGGGNYMYTDGSLKWMPPS